MYQEWFQFVDKEKGIRLEIDDKVNELLEEMADIKAWTITQVWYHMAYIKPGAPWYVCEP